MDIYAGIAQGTILGPLIFIFYFNDIVYSLKDCHISLFADDCILYLDGNNWPLIIDKIQQDLFQIEKWCHANALSINASKTKSMILGARSRLNCIDYERKFRLDNNSITFVKQFTYLGIILDTEMTLKPLLGM